MTSHMMTEIELFLAAFANMITNSIKPADWIIMLGSPVIVTLCFAESSSAITLTESRSAVGVRTRNALERAPTLKVDKFVRKKMSFIVMVFAMIQISVVTSHSATVLRMEEIAKQDITLPLCGYASLNRYSNAKNVEYMNHIQGIVEHFLKTSQGKFASIRKQVLPFLYSTSLVVQHFNTIHQQLPKIIIGG